MSPDVLLAVVFGGVLGLGLWSVLAALPRFSRPSLIDRVAPYVTTSVADVGRRNDVRSTGPVDVVVAVFGAPTKRVVRGIASLVGGTERLSGLLRQAGRTRSVESFRALQLGWSVAAALAVVTLALVFGLSARPGVLFAAPMAAAVVTFLVCEEVLGSIARRRSARILAEVPTTLEFLSLCLAAGESALDALRRVSTVSRGEFARELGIAVGQASTGATLPDALRAVSARVRVPAVDRAVEQLTAALERGNPLAEILRAQAADARTDAKRRLLEAAARKEIAMLFPLVFLILPLSVCFALFPGLVVLRMGF